MKCDSRCGSGRAANVSANANGLASWRRLALRTALGVGIVGSTLLVGPELLAGTFDDDVLPAGMPLTAPEVYRTRQARERDSQEVLSAFKPVMIQAPNCTVEISDGSKRIALGTVVSADGQILTKASLLAGRPLVALGPDRTVEAKVIGIDLVEDLALLDIDAEGLEPVRWVDDSAPGPGAWVVSADTDRRVRTIGVVSVVPRAIPKERGALGIRMDPEAEGVVISAFSGDDTPAEKAGIKVGDKVTEVNEEPIQSMAELQGLISQFSPGDAVILTVERAETSMAIEVTLDNLALIDPNARQREEQETLGADLSLVRTGFSSALQHDSTLKPTDCGGPLLDIRGNAVGINIARAGRVASYALPADTVRERLVKLQSGELAPDKVFADRIGRLDKALTRLATQLEGEVGTRMSAIEEELQTLNADHDQAVESLDQAEERLQTLEERIKTLTRDRSSLDTRIKQLREKSDDYRAQIEALRLGVRPR